eukprot:10127522-Alexandrium_andersonii.AAC.1
MQVLGLVHRDVIDAVVSRPAPVAAPAADAASAESAAVPPAQPAAAPGTATGPVGDGAPPPPGP